MGRSYLSNSIREQNNAEMQQQMAYRNMLMRQQQAAMEDQARQRQASQAAYGLMTRPPQNVAIPGATPMPGGGMGGYIPQPGGGGLGATQPPPQMPSMGQGEIYRPPPAPVTSGAAPIRDEGARAAPSAPEGVENVTVETKAPEKTSKFAPPKRPGLSLDQVGSYLDSMYPGMDPMTKLEAIKQYRELLSDEHKKELDDFDATIKGVNAETSSRQADTAAAREGRVAKQEGQRLGLDERRVKVLEGKAAQPAKVPVAMQRYQMAQKDAEASAREIKRIVSAQPMALGAWGAAYKGIGGLGAQFEQPTPEVADAAYQLNVEFENLFQALGVAGTYGGMGAAALTKRWESALGNKSLLTGKDRMITQMDQLLKGLDKNKPVQEEPEAPAQSDWSITPVQE